MSHAHARHSLDSSKLPSNFPIIGQAKVSAQSRHNVGQHSNLFALSKMSEPRCHLQMNGSKLNLRSSQSRKSEQDSSQHSEYKMSTGKKGPGLPLSKSVNQLPPTWKSNEKLRGASSGTCTGKLPELIVSPDSLAR